MWIGQLDESFVASLDVIRKVSTEGEGARCPVHRNQPKSWTQHQGLPFFHFSALFEKKLIKYLMNNMKSAAIVPQDRHIPSWTGRAFVSKAWRNGHKPKTCQWISTIRRRSAGPAENHVVVIAESFAESWRCDCVSATLSTVTRGD
jgi:hypothetical protein